MRHELAVRPLNAEALLMAFHTGQQHFTRHFQIGGIKIRQQGHGMLGQTLHLVQQAVVPEDPAPGPRGLGVAAFHDDGTAPGRIKGHGAGISRNFQIGVGMGHAEGTGTVHAVAAGFAARSHGPEVEGDHFLIKQSQNPVDGPGIGQGIRAPAHALGERQGRDHGRADPGQQIFGRRAAGALAHGHIFAFFRFQAKDVRHT